MGLTLPISSECAVSRSYRCGVLAQAGDHVSEGRSEKRAESTLCRCSRPGLPGTVADRHAKRQQNAVDVSQIVVVDTAHDKRRDVADGVLNELKTRHCIESMRRIGRCGAAARAALGQIKEVIALVPRVLVPAWTAISASPIRNGISRKYSTVGSQN